MEVPIDDEEQLLLPRVDVVLEWELLPGLCLVAPRAEDEVSRRVGDRDRLGRAAGKRRQFVRVDVVIPHGGRCPWLDKYLRGIP